MDEKFKSLLLQFEKSLADHILSRSEKRTLKVEAKDLVLTERDRQFLKSEIKKMAIAKAFGQSNAHIIEWMYEANKILSLPASPNKSHIPRVIFSPGDECREAIISHIRFANQSIRVCVFTISDDKISRELIHAHRRGKKVQIITDNEKQFDMGSDIEEFRKAGIGVIIDQTSAHMHHKFALIDQNITITGSYNWTRSAATSNHENILISKDPIIYKAYAKEFESLWKELN